MATPSPVQTFAHEALLYSGPGDFVARVAPFLRDGLDAGEAIMVAVTADKIAGLEGSLGADAARIAFHDMARVGHNPATIIPAWQRFIDGLPAGTAARGVGEPIWDGRTGDELVECQLHERLLNVAFAGLERFRLACPYDTATLPPAVLHEARCSHPLVVEDDGPVPSHEFNGLDRILEPFDTPLAPPPAAGTEALSFDRQGLEEVRALAQRWAGEAGLAPARAADVVLAVNEIASNSVRHGGGQGVLRAWTSGSGLVVEVRDRGRFTDPLAGRRAPSTGQVGGYGLWIANQVCDLVQVRSLPTGTAVRLHVRT